MIPASLTFRNLGPLGSHPVLDPLWNTETTTVVHHGAEASRVEKTASIAKHPHLLDQLQICCYAGGRNCGECEKCIRTALALHLLGVKAETLPPYRELGQLKLLKDIESDVHVPYLDELTTLAQEANEPAIARRLRRYVQRYRFEKIVREIIGVRGRKLIRQIRPRAWHNVRGSLQPVRLA